MTLQATIGPAKRPALRRKLRSLSGMLALALGLGAVQPALASTTTLTFDDLADGTGVTTQYQSVGVLASGAVVLFGLASPWPANSSPNLVYAPTGLMTFIVNSTITGDIQSVSAYVSGDTSVGIYAYDSGGALVGQALTGAASNNQLLSVMSSGGPIASIQIHDGGSSFAIDTLDFVSSPPPPPPPGAVPEPATGWLLGFGLLGLMGVARRKETAQASIWHFGGA